MSSVGLKIGDKDVVHHVTFVAADDEPARIEIRTAALSIIMVVNFTAPNEAPPTGSWEFRNDALYFTFKGWNNLLTSALGVPERIGDLNGRPLFFQLVHRKVGTHNEVSMWLLMGAAP